MTRETTSWLRSALQMSPRGGAFMLVVVGFAGMVAASCGASQANPSAPTQSSKPEKAPAPGKTQEALPRQGGESNESDTGQASGQGKTAPSPSDSSDAQPLVSDYDPGDSGQFSLGSHHVKPVVAANQPLINRHCWATAVKTNPSGPTKVRLATEVEVLPEGKVSKVTLVGGTPYPGFTDCVEKHVQHWKFPKAKNKSSLMFPLEFQRSEVEWKVKE